MAEKYPNYKYPPPGLYHTPAYQSAGKSYLQTGILQAAQNSGSIYRINFPYVTKNIVIKSISPRNVASAGSWDPQVTSPFTQYLYVYFGSNQDPTDAHLAVSTAHNTAAGMNSFLNYDGFGTANPPKPIYRDHVYVVEPSGSLTLGVKTDHINIVVIGQYAEVTGAFSVLGEMTSITSSNVPQNYYSGSGVNDIG